MPRDLHSPRYAKLREIIIEERKARGLTQAVIAARLGRPQSYVADIERRERRIDVIEFVMIAEAVGFDPAKALSDILLVA